MTFGERIRDRRLARGLTMAGLARAAGIGYRYVVKIENGVHRSPSEDVCRTLAAALGLDPTVVTLAAGRTPGDVARLLAEHPEAGAQLLDTVRGWAEHPPPTTGPRMATARRTP